MQRVRQFDSLQGFMNSFKQFEKKLDKLQADVNCHGNTLQELRLMVSNLSTGLVTDSYLQTGGDAARCQNCKSIGLQCKARSRRPEAIQPLANKFKAKSFQGQKYGLAKVSLEDKPFRTPKLSLPTVGFQQRRQGKAEAPRKTTSLRPQKPEKTSKIRKLLK